MMKQGVLHRAGYVIAFGENGIVESDTLMCVHCGRHWQVKPGSGTIRGFCGKCNGPTCGEKCKTCVPLEAKFEIVEGTRNPTAVSVNVPQLWLPGE